MNRSVSEEAGSSGSLADAFRRDYHGQMAIAHGLLGHDELASSHRRRAGSKVVAFGPDLIEAMISACDLFDSGADDGTGSAMDPILSTRLEAQADHWPDPVAAAVITRLARQITNFAEPDIAEALTRRLAQRLPADASVQHTLAYALLFSGRFEDSRAAAAAAAALAPDNAVHWIMLGNAEFCLGRPAEAERAFVTAFSLAPENEAPSTNLAILRIADGQLEAAEQHLDLAIRLAPPIDYLLSWKAILRLRQGRLDEALAASDAAAELCSLNFWTFSNRALCRLAMNDIDGAVADQAKARRYPHHSLYFDRIRPWASRPLTLLTAAANGDDAAKRLLGTTPCFP